MYGKLLAVAIFATSAMGASAMTGENAFQSLSRIHQQTSIVDVGIVRSESSGIVEIYTRGPDGAMILVGSEPVHAGANSNVRVHVSQPVRRDLLAVLRVNGKVLATHRFDVIKR
ncbi:hypothetical protein NHG85_10195 [Limimaricola sp. ASW11-118]|uniref:MSHA biogenesis protein MshK n=2 Tax=Limimaricola litoreus TaxID=2955316 RepID=A0A9X2FP78_9RHOB|nr:hypothetical protein [Limimaricola litoreus]